jgi:hypothetical protein
MQKKSKLFQFIKDGRSWNYVQNFNALRSVCGKVDRKNSGSSFIKLLSRFLQ